MAIREFTDSKGVRWRVWSVKPEAANAVNPELRQGWLSFDCPAERRRLAPIPADWEQLPDDRLELLCRVATPGRRSDPTGIPAVSEGDDRR